eukprot:3895340-Prymnesium_polylepis.1
MRPLASTLSSTETSGAAVAVVALPPRDERSHAVRSRTSASTVHATAATTNCSLVAAAMACSDGGGGGGGGGGGRLQNMRTIRKLPTRPKAALLKRAE